MFIKHCAPNYMLVHGYLTGLSITRFWGRNSAPFPMPKSMFFFPIPDKKFPISQKKKKKKKKKKIFFFFFFGSPSLFHIIQILKIKLNCLITNNYTLYIKKRGKFIIGINLAMETSYIRTLSNFPILVKTPLIFPIPWAPAPFPKRDVRALSYHYQFKGYTFIFTFSKQSFNEFLDFCNCS